ncbi:hypothetical protein DSAG12_03411 [Promethearchaeum syntrophicum]|uniref:Zinc-ribbon domain-containing protein n=1 Tax=Promethearchaeum syntrophicum TaxID=2594042 RepID=A0A5B9DEN8_9ARCH|nr:hypothetical protein [Candidatus Prometheoarchaeum syntrophicum]QEE17574.1 hypothetical protein DSAG12_03411 [Candidatus Prometheoarchaeum syntrophicum]
MKNKEKSVTADGLIGSWTGVAIFMVIMFAFSWWGVWWAYFPLIGIISGAIQQTVAYIQKKKALNEPNNTLSSPEAASIDETKEIAFCPGCGEKLVPNIDQCPTCGQALK